MTQATETTTDTLLIRSTKDYGYFKLMQGNREVDQNHVERLKISMQQNPDWFKTKPAVINAHGFIIDGQHRLEAARQLGLPFYYVVGENMNLVAAREMNISQKSWQLLDYAKSYADGGNINYQLILELARRYSNLALSVVIEAASDAEGRGDRHRSFREGKFTVNDPEAADHRVQYISSISRLTGAKLRVGFVRAILAILRRDDFDEERFLRNLEYKPSLLVQYELSQDNYHQLENVYNYNHAPQHHARFY